jgi:hypothetical protein
MIKEPFEENADAAPDWVATKGIEPTFLSQNVYT